MNTSCNIIYNAHTLYWKNGIVSIHWMPPSGSCLETHYGPDDKGDPKVIICSEESRAKLETQCGRRTVTADKEQRTWGWIQQSIRAASLWAPPHSSPHHVHWRHIQWWQRKFTLRLFNLNNSEVSIFLQYCYQRVNCANYP